MQTRRQFLQSLPNRPKGHTQLLLGIRAENVETFAQPVPGTLAAEIIVAEPLGSHNLITARLSDAVIKVNART